MVDDMELKEAIAHLTKTLSDPNHEWSCESCRKEHEQLLGWLIELQEVRNSGERSI